jgi:hypothetical protein
MIPLGAGSAILPLIFEGGAYVHSNGVPAGGQNCRWGRPAERGYELPSSDVGCHLKTRSLDRIFEDFSIEPTEWREQAVC